MTHEQYMKNLNVPAGPVDCVLDTDTYNEIDDQFALSLMVKSEKCNVKALLAAPFFNSNSTSPEDGMERSEAVVEAGRMRMRPVLMTALTTILGLLPMALGIGLGVTLVQPVAIAGIGGLAYATLMTLLLVPVLYDGLHKKPLRRVTAEELAETEETV